MRNLHYSDVSLVVDTDICSAIFAYAQALANAGRSDVIQVPILSEGQREFSNMLLSPATSLVCTPTREDEVDLRDEALLSYLQAKTRELAPGQAIAEASGGREASEFDTYEY